MNKFSGNMGRAILALFSLTCLLVVSNVVAANGRQRYDNYGVYRIDIETQEQLALLQQLESTRNELRFLDYPAQVNMSVEVAVAPTYAKSMKDLFKTHNMHTTLLTSNLQKIIDEERPARRKKLEGFGWEDYYTLDEIYEWIDTMVQQYPTVLTVNSIGRTYENRDMKVIKLSYKPGNQAIFIEANIHAREWITSATVTWILNELLTSEEPRVRYLAENYDWHIVPVSNPDGFEYSHTTDRLWRKTRNQHNTLCFGTDPNRNFNFQWNNGGTSMTPCSDTYSGPEPESEVEVSNISNYVKSVAAGVKLFLSIHSRGQLILCPFGYQDAPRAYNYRDLMQIGQRASVDMYKVHSKPYRVGTTSDVLYVASGIAVDWAFAVGGIPLAYTFELRDQVEFGFILPADQIVPNAQELLEGFIAIVDEAKVLGYL